MKQTSLDPNLNLKKVRKRGLVEQMVRYLKLL